MKKVIIRTDASTKIGSGHVMRCLTVAHNLKNQGYTVYFWMERLEGNLIDYVQKEGFVTIDEAVQADLYIVDHYQIDETWERQHRSYSKKIAVIDDLANRHHDCDLLLDQNVVPNYQNRYIDLVPTSARKLLGPKYLIMRNEFIQSRQQIRFRNGKVNRLLIFMGGSDPTNETLKVLSALDKMDYSFEQIDVVVGSSNTHKDKIKAMCKGKNFVYHCQINYIAQLMELADFSIGAGGATTWERCYLGLPSSSTIVADNQLISTNYAAELGAVWNLGWHEQVTVETYLTLLNSLQTMEVEIIKLSENGLELTQNDLPNAWLNEIMELLK